MVAENPLANGNHRRPSLPPEPPSNDGHTTTYNLIMSEVIEKKRQALLQTMKDTLDDLTTTANLALNL